MIILVANNEISVLLSVFWPDWARQMLQPSGRRLCRVFEVMYNQISAGKALNIGNAQVLLWFFDDVDNEGPDPRDVYL
jgi:hypothetical protein